MTSIRQMVARSNSGHAKALRAIADGKPLVGPGAFASEIRGMRTVTDTLSRWGAIETKRLGVGDYETTLTETGWALLISLDARTVGARP